MKMFTVIFTDREPLEVFKTEDVDEKEGYSYFLKIDDDNIYRTYSSNIIFNHIPGNISIDRVIVFNEDNNVIKTLTALSKLSVLIKFYKPVFYKDS